MADVAAPVAAPAQPAAHGEDSGKRLSADQLPQKRLSAGSAMSTPQAQPSGRALDAGGGDASSMIASVERAGPKKRRRAKPAAEAAPAAGAAAAQEQADTPAASNAPASTPSGPGRLITSYFSPQAAAEKPAGEQPSLLNALFSPLYKVFGQGGGGDDAEAAPADGAADTADASTEPPAATAAASTSAASEAAPSAATAEAEDQGADASDAAAEDDAESEFYEEFDPYLFIKSLPPLPADHAETVRVPRPRRPPNARQKRPELRATRRSRRSYRARRGTRPIPRWCWIWTKHWFTAARRCSPGTTSPSPSPSTRKSTRCVPTHLAQPRAG